MEHRNTARFEADRPDGAPAPTPASRRFARLVDHPAARRLSRPRLILAALAALAAVALLVRGGATAVRAAREWLHAHPTQQIALDQVELVPPPDPWIKSGKATFLRAVGEGDRVSLPGLDLDDVRKALQLCPWVKGVGRIERGPGTLRIPLTYYQPVAMAQVGVDRWVVIDRDATILPGEDIAWEAGTRSTPRGRAEPLMILKEFAPPDDLRPGSFWGQGGRPAPTVREAARLADFLAAKARAEPEGGLRFRGIMPPPKGNGPVAGLFAQIDGGNFVYWDLSESSVPGRPTADDCWDQLRDWVKAHPRVKLREGNYIHFTAQGVVEYVSTRKPTEGGRGSGKP